MSGRHYLFEVVRKAFDRPVVELCVGHLRRGTSDHDFYDQRVVLGEPSRPYCKLSMRREDEPDPPRLCPYQGEQGHVFRDGDEREVALRRCTFTGVVAPDHSRETERRLVEGGLVALLDHSK